MKKSQRIITSLVTILFLSGLTLVTPVSAHGTDDTSADTTNSSSESASSDSSNSHNEIENHANDLTNQFKAQAHSDLQALKQSKQQHTQAQRQTACEARKSSLTKREANAVSWATKHHQVIDSIYSKVKAFHDSKQLNVANYDSLTTAVDQAQANAAASIDALQALQVNVDCSSQTVGESVAAFQQAVKATRDSLKTYRSSLVDLITALKGASTSSSADDSSTNSAGQ